MGKIKEIEIKNEWCEMDPDEKCAFDPDSGYGIKGCDYGVELHEQGKGKKDCEHWKKKVFWSCPNCGEELQPVTSWIKCTDKMPEPERIVLAYLKNAVGKGRRIRAQWIPSNYTEVSYEPWEDNGNIEYIEEENTYFLKEGWHEINEYGQDEDRLYKVTDTITHWQPLPEFPTEG
jgi:hypothetical protein